MAVAEAVGWGLEMGSQGRDRVDEPEDVPDYGHDGAGAGVAEACFEPCLGLRECLNEPLV
jgi:hypothetical protein